MAVGSLRSCAGFTYLGVLFAVAVAGVVLAGTGVLWSIERQREQEVELLFVGDQYRRAIASYYEGSPGLVKRYPAKLDDLLGDNRFLGIKRHLRRPFRDPLTGSAEWGLMYAPEGGIMGVHSLSNGVPLKQANFREVDAAFESKGRYVDWRFVYRPVVSGARK